MGVALGLIDARCRPRPASVKYAIPTRISATRELLLGGLVEAHARCVARLWEALVDSTVMAACPQADAASPKAASPGPPWRRSQAEFPTICSDTS